MFECLILGDSIGLGTAREINARYAKRCEVMAVERVSAEQILAWKKPPKPYGACILAVGSNDLPTAALVAKLRKLRRQLVTRRAIWLLPYSRPRAYLVNSVAVTFGDETLDLQRFATRDHVHPLHYAEVAKLLLK